MTVSRPQTPDTISRFLNEPLLEFRLPAVREAARAALDALDARLPLDVPLVLAHGEERGEVFDVVDPAMPSTVVARCHAASAEHVELAMAAAVGAESSWGTLPAAERAGAMRGAADLLRQRRLELAALAVREAGKPWVEADGDICEAIDFLNYYAAGALGLADGPALVQLPGERNVLRYSPRGVCVVIAPWNFPLAIVAGMVSAALVTGNPVILKPAEQAPACAKAIVDALHEAGVPRGALQMLPGGDEPAKALVAHPQTRLIAFTGSCAAGLNILETAATVVPGQRHLKRVIAEMGGKNCVFVDADADLDDAVPAIIRSAFGFAGQKCSAASRVLAHEAIADLLVERLGAALHTLRLGPAEDFATDVPPVIDQDSQRRIAEYCASAGQVPTVQLEVPSTGFFAPPTLFVGLPASSPVITTELFGPVLSVERVDGMTTALELINGAALALTCGIFSRSPQTVAAFTEAASVGNIYVNREITGAMVGRQPFGGNRLSGTGAKAGGPNYLLEFVQAHSICENTMRHGLIV